MRVLVAFEQSQRVTVAIRRRGIEAFSCDLLPAGGGQPDWHIQGDAVDVIRSGAWDAVIAFPPCTDLAVSGARYFEEKRRDGRQQQSIDLFMSVVDSDAAMHAIENPVGIMSSVYRPPDQIIQPWQFGHGETKSTCLWLKALPPLRPTNIVDGREARIHRMPPSPDRAMLRSLTYQGVAEAMAEQWRPYLTGEKSWPVQLKLFDGEPQ